MDSQTAPVGAGPRPIFEDGFGTRWLAFDPETSDPVELLSLAPRLVEAPGFAEALGERVARLARNRHMSYARVRRLDRPASDSLVLVSDRVAGWRLRDVLEVIEREGLVLDISAIIGLMRQLIPAAAMFSRQQRDAANGSIGPERLLLTPNGRLVIADYVLGPAVEKLQMSRDRLWRELRLAIPPLASGSKLPPAADVVGMAVVALSLVLGRPLRENEFLVSLGDLLEMANENSGGTARPLSPGLRDWLARAFQFDETTSLDSPQDAQVAFEEMLAKERGYVTSPALLESFIARLQKIVGPPPVAEPPGATGAAGAEGATGAAGATGAPAAAEAPAGASAPAVPVAPTAPTATAPSEPVARVAPVTPTAPGEPVAPVTPSAPAAPAAPVSKQSGVFTRSALGGYAAAEPDSTAPAPAPRPPRWVSVALVVFAALALVEAGLIAYMLMREDAPALTDRGALVVRTRPTAARVVIDGEERGLTPYTADLSTGIHILEVRVGRSEPRVIPVQIRSGIESNIYVELQSVAMMGVLDIRSDPARASVIVDGQARGETPLVVRDLPPGEHEVVIEAGTVRVRQTVRVEPGLTTQLVVPLGSR